jgi:WD40 repeat protein
MLATASLELKAEKQSAHSDSVYSVAFSPDGSTIVSGSRDRTIKVWDAGVPAH